MQTIWDSKGRPFYLLITVCMDKDYWAYRNPINEAVQSIMTGKSGSFIIYGRAVLQIHATFPSCRIVPIIVISKVTGLPIVTLGCHTFTGSNVLTLMTWLKG